MLQRNPALCLREMYPGAHASSEQCQQGQQGQQCQKRRQCQHVSMCVFTSSLQCQQCQHANEEHASAVWQGRGNVLERSSCSILSCCPAPQRQAASGL